MPEVLLYSFDADGLAELVDVAQVLEGGFEGFYALHDQFHADYAVFVHLEVQGRCAFAH